LDGVPIGPIGTPSSVVFFALFDVFAPKECAPAWTPIHIRMLRHRASSSANSTQDHAAIIGHMSSVRLTRCEMNGSIVGSAPGSHRTRLYGYPSHANTAVRFIFDKLLHFAGKLEKSRWHSFGAKRREPLIISFVWPWEVSDLRVAHDRPSTTKARAVEAYSERAGSMARRSPLASFAPLMR
jgi:hypothetical protein